MFGITLTHKLFESAIDVLFNTLSSNFTNTTSTMLGIGKTYKSITLRRSMGKSMQVIDELHNANVVEHSYEKYAGELLSIYKIVSDRHGHLIRESIVIETEILDIKI
jgi:hypothetical protein